MTPCKHPREISGRNWQLSSDTKAPTNQGINRTIPFYPTCDFLERSKAGSRRRRECNQGFGHQLILRLTWGGWQRMPRVAGSRRRRRDAGVGESFFSVQGGCLAHDRSGIFLLALSNGCLLSLFLGVKWFYSLELEQTWFFHLPQSSKSFQDHFPNNAFLLTLLLTLFAPLISLSLLLPLSMSWILNQAL